MSYTPLHVHSEYSLLDGLSKTSQIASRIKDIGATSCALTDHGTVSGAVDFVKTMKDNGLKPILGCEVYICHGDSKDRTPDNKALFHQVILAKNLEGWKALLELVAMSNHPDRFYHKPRISFYDISKVDTSNLITFSGHLGSYLANSISKDDKILPNWQQLGIDAVNLQKKLFGDNFYVEIQMVDSDRNPFSKKVAECLREIASITNTPCVATPDAHYARREDAIDQRVLLCTSLKKTLGQIQMDIKQGNSVGLQCFFESDNFHIPSFEEMKQWHTDEEIENTNKIANMCDDYSILSAPNPPTFKCPGGMTPDDFLRHLCRQGWKKKMAHIDDEEELKVYGERVNHELEVFLSCGLSSYFLIVRDIIKFCHENGYITGPGRGSAAGCMVSYLIDITQIDPIPADLLFERFYNAGRNSPGKISWPDIDIDVPKEARPKVIEYVRDKYGEDNVAQIVTYTTLKGRSALKRVMHAVGGISFTEQNAMTKYILDEASIADELQEMKEELGTSSIIRWCIENNPKMFKDWVEINEDGELVGDRAEIFKQAIRLEGTKIIQSKHAAGVVISPYKISDTCPMVRSTDANDKGYIAGFEGPSCEEVGLLKIDVLGITMLDKVMSVADILAGVE
jgi:DNA polymerase-3 subunit alpha